MTVERIEEEVPDDSLKTEAPVQTDADKEFSIELTTDVGKILLSQKTKDKKIELNTESLTKGIYILKIHTGKEIVTERVVIE